MIFPLKTTSLVMPAAFADIDDMAEIHNKCFSRGWTDSELQALLQDRLVEAFVLRRTTMRITDKPVGFVLARSVVDEAEILTIAVDPDHQNSGAGKQLMQEMIRFLYGNRIAKLFLEVDAGNKAALSLYQGLGFTKVGERKGYYHNDKGQASTAWIMQIEPLKKRRLPGSPEGEEKASSL
ncbi:ribosomal protein S18-alanine N-acetyltransferase [uncultured Cohaesibacter sp.]|uniref:ribosomal protein S18-alanine N-acetyltransferase n=1 Tax=uncultured Cohaesibacter sp. TaxID=1002546 RepID=UPI0029C65957|nr:ribosomal protein S18-alanine N-acetyltransferase [uncultured Cohaesibacter sp.]